jgi:hypothetical protein
MDKFGKIVGVGFKIFAAFAAGYFVHRMVDDKANELVQDGGVVNAMLIGAGEGAVIAAASILAYHIV